MGYNMFVQMDGTAYGGLACSVSSKNVPFELEPQAEMSTYGEALVCLGCWALLSTLCATTKIGWERRTDLQDIVKNNTTF